MRALKLLFVLAFVIIASSVQAGQNSSESKQINKNFIGLKIQQYQQMSPEDRAKQETEWMKKDLQLTAAQLPKVDSINLKYAKKRSEMRNQMQGLDRDSRMAKMQEMQSQKDAELKPVLTDDQMKKYKELLPQRRGMRGQGQGQGNS